MILIELYSNLKVRKKRFSTSSRTLKIIKHEDKMVDVADWARSKAGKKAGAKVRDTTPKSKPKGGGSSGSSKKGRKSYTDKKGVIRYEGTTGYKETEYQIKQSDANRSHSKDSKSQTVRSSDELRKSKQKYTVRIKDTKTGEIRDYPTDNPNFRPKGYTKATVIRNTDGMAVGSLESQSIKTKGGQAYTTTKGRTGGETFEARGKTVGELTDFDSKAKEFIKEGKINVAAATSAYNEEVIRHNAAVKKAEEEALKAEKKKPYAQTKKETTLPIVKQSSISAAPKETLAQKAQAKAYELLGIRSPEQLEVAKRQVKTSFGSLVSSEIREEYYGDTDIGLGQKMFLEGGITYVQAVIGGKAIGALLGSGSAVVSRYIPKAAKSIITVAQKTPVKKGLAFLGSKKLMTTLVTGKAAITSAKAFVETKDIKKAAEAGVISVTRSTAAITGASLGIQSSIGGAYAKTSATLPKAEEAARKAGESLADYNLRLGKYAGRRGKMTKGGKTVNIGGKTVHTQRRGSFRIKEVKTFVKTETGKNVQTSRELSILPKGKAVTPKNSYPKGFGSQAARPPKQIANKGDSGTYLLRRQVSKLERQVARQKVPKPLKKMLPPGQRPTNTGQVLINKQRQIIQEAPLKTKSTDGRSRVMEKLKERLALRQRRLSESRTLDFDVKQKVNLDFLQKAPVVKETEVVKGIKDVSDTLTRTSKVKTTYNPMTDVVVKPKVKIDFTPSLSKNYKFDSRINLDKPVKPDIYTGQPLATNIKTDQLNSLGMDSKIDIDFGIVAGTLPEIATSTDIDYDTDIKVDMKRDVEIITPTDLKPMQLIEYDSKATTEKPIKNIITGIQTESRQFQGDNIIDTDTNKPIKDKPRKPIERPPQKPIRNYIVDKPTLPFRPRPPNRIPPPPTPIRPGFFGLPTLDYDSRRRQESGFNVFARVRGNWKKISKEIYSEVDAKNFGAVYVGTTPAASFRYEEAGEPVTDTYLKKGFMSDFKRKSGNLFIEKATRRIKSPGELRGITYKGQAARRKKRGRGIFKNIF